MLGRDSPRKTVGLKEHSHPGYEICYIERGTVTVKATIGPSGAVTVAQVIKSTAQNAKVDTCVVDAFKKIKFPPPKDGGTSVITFPMEFQGVEQVK